MIGGGGGGLAGVARGGTMVGSSDSLDPNWRRRTHGDFWLEMKNAQ